MNAIQFILREHKKIKASFAKITKKNRAIPAQKRFFAKLSKFLASHEKMEEKLWYPQLKKIHPQLKKTIAKLITEEKAAGKTIKKMKSIKNEQTWEKILLKLKKDVLKHATDEETKLFPKVKKIVKKETLDMIGKKLRAFRVKHKYSLR